MNPHRLLFRASVWLLALLISTLAGPARAAVEHRPALPSDLATESLLLGIARAGERLVAAGERGHILYSDDNGNTWQQGQVPMRQTLTDIAFANPRRGWAVGHDGMILGSRDGGETWTIEHDGTVYAAERARRKVREAQAALVQARTAVAELEDALAAAKDDADREALMWELEDARYAVEDAELDLALAEQAMENPLAEPLLALHWLDAEHVFAVGAYNHAFVTEDGGTTWRDFSTALPNEFGLHLNAMVGVGAALFIAGEAGTLFRSGDAGQSWQSLSSPYVGSFFGAHYRQDQLVIFGLRGHLFHSNNNGESWQAPTTDTEKGLNAAVKLPDGRLLIVGNSGVLLLSDDGGASVNQRQLPSRASLVDVTVAANGEVIAVGEHGIHNLTPLLAIPEHADD